MGDLPGEGENARFCASKMVSMSEIGSRVRIEGETEAREKRKAGK